MVWERTQYSSSAGPWSVVGGVTWCSGGKTRDSYRQGIRCHVVVGGPHWSHSSSGRAPGCRPGGCEFDSRWLRVSESTYLDCGWSFDRNALGRRPAALRHAGRAGLAMLAPMLSRLWPVVAMRLAVSPLARMQFSRSSPYQELYDGRLTMLLIKQAAVSTWSQSSETAAVIQAPQPLRRPALSRCSSAGRALASGASGRTFEPCHLGVVTGSGVSGPAQRVVTPRERVQVPPP